MSDKKKNIPLIVALSIPVLMVAVITVSIYVPTLFIKPQFDFIYSTGENYCYINRYSVVNQKVAQNQGKKNNETDYCRNSPDPRLFYFDVESFTSNEIQLSEAQKYSLDNRLKSPDGFEVAHGNHSFDLFFFGGSSYNDKYLKKGAFSRKIATMKPYYYYNFKFLGWVKE